MTVRLLTNIGRLWTGHEVCSNAAILVHNDRIAWVAAPPTSPRASPVSSTTSSTWTMSRTWAALSSRPV